MACDRKVISSDHKLLKAMEKNSHAPRKPPYYRPSEAFLDGEFTSLYNFTKPILIPSGGGRGMFP